MLNALDVRSSAFCTWNDSTGAHHEKASEDHWRSRETLGGGSCPIADIEPAMVIGSQRTLIPGVVRSHHVAVREIGRGLCSSQRPARSASTSGLTPMTGLSCPAGDQVRCANSVVQVPIGATTMFRL